jgi:predicted enzyme related to lactoylglutathione lyase
VLAAVDDLEGGRGEREGGGGEIALAIFAFFDGRRFHFRDPAGHELGLAQVDPADS